MDWHFIHIAIESAALAYIVLAHNQHKQEREELRNIIFGVANGTAKVTLGPDNTIRVTGTNRR